MTDILVISIASAAGLFVLAAIFELRARRRALGDVLSHPPATPPSVYPRINSAVCICSGACVSACPEGNVLEIVGGRPRLVRPSACVSHGDCLRSCPVSAIELVLGSADRAVEVPISSGTFETTVPGLYVAGEVNGIGRIHVAVAQGRQAAAAALDDSGTHGCDLDLAIVGAGPAGISAALEAHARGARYTVFERTSLAGAILSYPREKIVMTSALDLAGIGNLKLRRTTKEALVELFETIVEQVGLSVTEHEAVTDVQTTALGLRVRTTSRTVTAHRVVLAIGRRGTPRRLGVPGEQLPHVVHQVEHPAAYAGRRAVVVGGGNSAVEVALALSAQPGTEVTLIHRGRDFSRCHPANQRALERAGSRITVLTETVVRAIRPDAIEIAREARGGVNGPALPVRRLACSLVACCLGSELPSPWLRTLGIDIRELRGEVIAGPRHRASASHDRPGA
jgi:thioredoxin reductase (NADPH)